MMPATRDAASVYRVLVLVAYGALPVGGRARLW